MSVKILAVGDVCGEPGLDYIEKLPQSQCH